MPLNEQKIFLNFNKGVDTGRDPKTVIPSKFTKLDNLEWDKFDTVRQRPGYTRATITAHTGSATVANVRQLHVLGAELLLEAASGFHAFAQNITVSRDGRDGTSSSDIKQFERGQIDFTQVSSSQRSVIELDAAAASPSGVECWVWAEDPSMGGGTLLWYQVLDGKTRAILQEGQLAGTIGSVSAVTPRVLVRNNAGASRFYIYYSDGSAGLQRKYIDVASGTKVPGALSTAVVLNASISPVFDAWYDSTGDVILLAYTVPGSAELTLSILAGSDGTTVSATSTQALTAVSALRAVSVVATYNGATGYALAVYVDTLDRLIKAFSTKFDGTSDLATTLTSGATTGGGLVDASSSRLAVIASPHGTSNALVFYDTDYTTGGYAPFFPVDIGFVRCNYNGASPALQGTFARGVRLGAKPVGYTVGGAATDTCVTALLPSTRQPTTFMLKFGGTTTETYGCGTIAAATHVPPRVLARVLSSEAGDSLASGPRRLASPLAIV